jgi:hypothetical protein
MHVVAGLGKVAPRELMRREEGEDLGVNRWTHRLDRIQHRRIATLLIAVEVGLAPQARDESLRPRDSN